MTPAYAKARQSLFDYFVENHGLTLLNVEMDEIERLALDVARAQEGADRDQKRLDLMELEGVAVTTINDDAGKRTGWAGHTDSTGWCGVHPNPRAAIDAALEALKQPAVDVTR